MFKLGNYQVARECYEKILAIDPEDLGAHYNLMLCYQGVGNVHEEIRQPVGLPVGEQVVAGVQGASGRVERVVLVSAVAVDGLTANELKAHCERPAHERRSRPLERRSQNAPLP